MAAAALSLTLAACGGGSLTSSTGTGSSSGGSGTSSGGNLTVSAVTVTTSTPSIVSDGSTSAVITALVRDATNNLIAGVPVTFSATSGGLAVTNNTTDSSGAAVATLTTAGDSTLRTITVTVTAGGQMATVPVAVVAGQGTTTVQMGSPAGAGFVSGKIGISSTTLSAGGSTTLSVALQQSDGTLYTQSTSVTFSSTCTGTGAAKIGTQQNPTNNVITTTTGVATATYVAAGCSGADPITATATVGQNALSATGTVTIAAASIGSIVYKSATYTVISLKGSGSASRPETSTVVFEVEDQSGNPVPGATVAFALNTTVGGITVSPTTVTSDANGLASTTVQAGTVATPVRVTATVQNTTPAISTQSNQLSVSTGVPTQVAFSLAVQCQNVEAYNLDGITVPVTARLADRFSNPVADGTAVQFNASGGHIQPQCTTQTTSTESGLCSVNWVSADPRPQPPQSKKAGRVRVFAMAIGEESFVDANGNGTFDNGETFTDLAEGYRDDNENGMYDVGEFFYDFNNNGSRDPPDGIFNGVLCKDTTGRCDPNKTSSGITAANYIIMSTQTPGGISPGPGTSLGTLNPNNSATYAFLIADDNGNPMANGTTVTAQVSGTGVSIPGVSSYTYPCTINPLSYAFTVVADSTATGTATLTITVTSKPSNTAVSASYPITL
jgi:hypothetical protein